MYSVAKSAVSPLKRNSYPRLTERRSKQRWKSEGQVWTCSLPRHAAKSVRIHSSQRPFSASWAVLSRSRRIYVPRPLSPSPHRRSQTSPRPSFFPATIPPDGPSLDRRREEDSTSHSLPSGKHALITGSGRPRLFFFLFDFSGLRPRPETYTLFVVRRQEGFRAASFCSSPAGTPLLYL